MHTTKRGEPSAINQALNKPRAKLGLDLSAWMAIVFVCVTVFLVGFRMLAILSFPTLAGGAWFIVRKHPKCFNCGASASARRATMTRANTEQIKHTPWFAKAGAACSIVPLSRFVGPKIFALKGGGYPRELTVYTSDGCQTASSKLAVRKELAAPAIAEIPTPKIEVHSIEFEGYAIELSPLRTAFPPLRTGVASKNAKYRYKSVVCECIGDLAPVHEARLWGRPSTA
jgi:hypothetical protein